MNDKLRLHGKESTCWISYRLRNFLITEKEKEVKTGLHKIKESLLLIVKISIQGKNKKKTKMCLSSHSFLYSCHFFPNSLAILGNPKHK